MQGGNRQMHQTIRTEQEPLNDVRPIRHGHVTHALKQQHHGTTKQQTFPIEKQKSNDISTTLRKPGHASIFRVLHVLSISFVVWLVC